MNGARVVHIQTSKDTPGDYEASGAGGRIAYNAHT